MQQERYNYDTVSQAMNDLTRRGYTKDFTLHPEDECLICHKTATSLASDEFQIDEVYRFEGISDPGDEMIVFAISSDKHDVKGMVVSAFGIYAEDANSNLVKYLNSHL